MSRTPWARGVLLLCLSLSTLLACSQNAFLESAKKDTDPALLFEARKKMNSSDWTEAIALINRMSSTGLAQRETKVVLASAYAGECGLDLIRLADQISNSSGINLFAVLLSSQQTATAASVTACQSAESTLASISTVAAERTADENTMMAFIGFTKIGAVLATYADTNDDGSADVGFDSCNTATLPDAMLREIGTGVTLAVSSLVASGGSIASGVADSVTNACADIAAVDPDYDFCTVTTASAFTAEQVQALGGLVKSSDAPGLGTCAGDLATCVCP